MFAIAEERGEQNTIAWPAWSWDETMRRCPRLPVEVVLANVYEPYRRAHAQEWGEELDRQFVAHNKLESYFLRGPVNRILNFVGENERCGVVTQLGIQQFFKAFLHLDIPIITNCLDYVVPTHRRSSTPADLLMGLLHRVNSRINFDKIHVEAGDYITTCHTEKHWWLYSWVLHTDTHDEALMRWHPKLSGMLARRQWFQALVENVCFDAKAVNRWCMYSRVIQCV